MADALFLSHRIPYPPDKGDKIRAWHMLEHIARTHRVHLGCFVDDPADAVHETYLRSVCASVCCVPSDRRAQKLRALAGLRPGRPLTLDFYRSTALARWVDNTIAAQPIALEFAYCSAMAPYVMEHQPAKPPPGHGGRGFGKMVRVRPAHGAARQPGLGAGGPDFAAV